MTDKIYLVKDHHDINVSKLLNTSGKFYHNDESYYHHKNAHYDDDGDDDNDDDNDDYDHDNIKFNKPTKRKSSSRRDESSSKCNSSNDNNYYIPMRLQYEPYDMFFIKLFYQLMNIIMHLQQESWQNQLTAHKLQNPATMFNQKQNLYDLRLFCIANNNKYQLDPEKIGEFFSKLSESDFLKILSRYMHVIISQMYYDIIHIYSNKIVKHLFWFDTDAYLSEQPSLNEMNQKAETLQKCFDTPIDIEYLDENLFITVNKLSIIKILQYNDILTSMKNYYDIDAFNTSILNRFRLDTSMNDNNHIPTKNLTEKKRLSESLQLVLGLKESQEYNIEEPSYIRTNYVERNLLELSDKKTAPPLSYQSSTDLPLLYNPTSSVVITPFHPHSSRINYPTMQINQPNTKTTISNMYNRENHEQFLPNRTNIVYQSEQVINKVLQFLHIIIAPITQFINGSENYVQIPTIVLSMRDDVNLPHNKSSRKQNTSINLIQNNLFISDHINI